MGDPVYEEENVWGRPEWGFSVGVMKAFGTVRTAGFDVFTWHGAGLNSHTQFGLESVRKGGRVPEGRADPRRRARPGGDRGGGQGPGPG